MRDFLLGFFYIVVLLALLAVKASAMPEGVTALRSSGDYSTPFRFEDGETVPALRLHYTTLGMPRRDASGQIMNAVLLLHGTTDDGTQFLTPSFGGELFGKGQPLDSSVYYLILPDALGHGGSSKPSDGLRTHFPHYNYADMVAAQYRLVTKHLGVVHLRLVLGTSMGGMQTWMWGEQYPAMMDGLMPIAAEPAPVSGRNLLWRQIIIAAIRTDPEWNGGDYQAQPHGFTSALPIFNLMTDNPVHFQETLPTVKSAELSVAAASAKARDSQDANDVLYALEASDDYNPAPALRRIRAVLFAVNFADDAVNPVEVPSLQNAVTQVRRGRYVLVPCTAQSRGHLTYQQAAIWKPHLTALIHLLSPHSLSD